MHAMKAWRGCRGIAPFVCNLGTRWKWLVNPMPRPLHSQGKISDNHWIGGCVGPFASLLVLENRKISSICEEWIPNGPASSLVTIVLFYLGHSVYMRDSTTFFLCAAVTVNLLGLCLWYAFKMTHVVAISITWFWLWWASLLETVPLSTLSPSWSKIWRYLCVLDVHHCDSWRIRDQLDVTSY